MTSKVHNGKNPIFAQSIHVNKDSAFAAQIVENFYKFQHRLQEFNFAGIKINNARNDFEQQIRGAEDLNQYAIALNLVSEATLGDKHISTALQQSFEGSAGFSGYATIIIMKLKALKYDYLSKKMPINEKLTTILSAQPARQIADLLQDTEIKEIFDSLTFEIFTDIVKDLDLTSINAVELFEIIDEKNISVELMNITDGQEQEALPKRYLDGVFPAISPVLFMDILNNEINLYSILQSKTIDNNYSYIYDQPYALFKDMEIFAELDGNLYKCNDSEQQCFSNLYNTEKLARLVTAFENHLNNYISDILPFEFSELFGHIKENSIELWTQKNCRVNNFAGFEQKEQLNCQELAQSLESIASNCNVISNDYCIEGLLGINI